MSLRTKEILFVTAMLLVCVVLSPYVWGETTAPAARLLLSAAALSAAANVIIRNGFKSK